ncbi:MAG: hypothetical protein ACI9UJ_002270, partial [bacterium]
VGSACFFFLNKPQEVKQIMAVIIAINLMTQK